MTSIAALGMSSPQPRPATSIAVRHTLKARKRNVGCDWTHVSSKTNATLCDFSGSRRMADSIHVMTAAVAGSDDESV